MGYILAQSDGLGTMLFTVEYNNETYIYAVYKFMRLVNYVTVRNHFGGSVFSGVLFSVTLAS